MKAAADLAERATGSASPHPRGRKSRQLRTLSVEFSLPSRPNGLARPALAAPSGIR
ncbi:hypothetical protein [Streptomyces xanthochromogenes]|uniref:hypothetical protein n=1 Tax=Streptomyces xanthochromogenes TaxID=67384 RepID=UPI00341F13A8